MWRPFIPVGRAQLNFLDATAIRSLIIGFRLPRVLSIATAIPLSSHLCVNDTFSLFAVECRYRDGVAHLYAIDTGTVVIIVASDFTPCMDHAEPDHAEPGQDGEQR
ncbi:hypothetical protein AB0M95_40260 [Sphaerisporangium sp. NPDC051017]|uniref:hypothetical protein n=1 Tax=Sphaerisporangium sp. NPDC051017 TaxID=3154636 RepID=UPI003413B22B